MGKTTNSIKEFATIAFILLGVLFGMMIMTFIFAQLGPQNSGLTVEDPGYNESLEVQNNSLTGIVSYTAQSDTQMITVAIAITLVILVAVFLFFWKAFVSDSKGKGSSSGATFG